MIQQPIKMRVPMRVGNDQVELLIQVSDQDARKIVDASRRTVRDLDQGMFQTIRDSLRTFLDRETGDKG